MQNSDNKLAPLCGESPQEIWNGIPLHLNQEENFSSYYQVMSPSMFRPAAGIGCFTYVLTATTPVIAVAIEARSYPSTCQDQVRITGLA